MLTKCEGIVIRTMDYGESNKIVTLYTRELGKVGVMARGAKKPSSKLTAVSQLFQYGYYMFHSSNGLGTLQQGEMIASLRGIREDIFKTAYASYIAELLDKGTEEKKRDPYLFQLFLQALEHLNEGYDPEIVTNIFEVKMLGVFGFSPVLNRCVNCGEQEGRFSFSIREGGLLCHRCLHTDRYCLSISPAVARLLRLFAYLDLGKLGSISVKQETKDELRKVLDAYYDEYLGAVIKSKKFLDQIGRLRNQL